MKEVVVPQPQEGVLLHKGLEVVTEAIQSKSLMSNQNGTEVVAVQAVCTSTWT